jgi:hypothetical protein
MPTAPFQIPGGNFNDAQGNPVDYRRDPNAVNRQGAYGHESYYRGDHNEVTSASQCFLF